MKHNNICIIEIVDGKQVEQRIENQFEKVMMENFPNLMREKHTSPGSTEGPKQRESKEAHSKTNHN